MENAAKKEEFKLIVDHKPHVWPLRYITGKDLKILAGVDPEAYSVWQEVPGPKDPEIPSDGKADLGGKGVEKFFTGKKQTTEGSHGASH